MEEAELPLIVATAEPNQRTPPSPLPAHPTTWFQHYNANALITRLHFMSPSPDRQASVVDGQSPGEKETYGQS